MIRYITVKLHGYVNKSRCPVYKKLMDLRWIMHTKYAFKLRSLSRFIRRDLHFLHKASIPFIQLLHLKLEPNGRTTKTQIVLNLLKAVLL